jgi:hypothetical protein
VRRLSSAMSLLLCGCSSPAAFLALPCAEDADSGLVVVTEVPGADLPRAEVFARCAAASIIVELPSPVTIHVLDGPPSAYGLAEGVLDGLAPRPRILLTRAFQVLSEPTRLEEGRLELALPALEPVACVEAGWCVSPRDRSRCVACRATPELTPDPPSPPRRPRLTPCPPGWVQDEQALDAGPLAVCEPPIAPARVECPQGHFQPYGAVGCEPLSPDPCGRFAANLDATRSTLYVDPSAAPPGVGSLAAPLVRVADAVAAAPDGAVVALSSGVHTVPGGLFVGRSLELRGACAESTVVLVEGACAVELLAPASLSIRDLTLRGRSGICVRPGGAGASRGTLDASNLAIEASDVGIEVPRGGSTFVAGRRLSVRGGGLSFGGTRGSLDQLVVERSPTHALEADDSTLALSRVVIHDVAPGAPGGTRAYGLRAETSTLTLSGAWLGKGPGHGLRADASSVRGADVWLETFGKSCLSATESQVVLTRLVARSSAEPELFLPMSRVALTDAVIHRTESDGRETAISAPAELRAERVRIVSEGRLLNIGQGGLVALRDGLLLATGPLRAAQSVVVSDSGRLALERVHVASASRLLLTGASTTTLTDVLLEFRGAPTDADDGGLDLRDRGRLSAERLRVEGLGVRIRPGVAYLRDLSVEGAVGAAVRVQSGSRVELERALLSSSAEGLVVGQGGSPSSCLATDLDILDAPGPAAASACPLPGAGLCLFDVDWSATGEFRRPLVGRVARARVRKTRGVGLVLVGEGLELEELEFVGGEVGLAVPDGVDLFPPLAEARFRGQSQLFQLLRR